MKANKYLIFISVILGLTFFSCDNPLFLGSKLDVDGPVINFTSPNPRKAVKANFTLEGTADDYTGIHQMLVKIQKNRENQPKEWRYTRGEWEISEDFGISWTAFENAEWNGTEKKASWSIDIDMSINGNPPEDGEYVFSVQAWDYGLFSDDNSFKTLVLIIDNDPPSVDISNPFLHNRYIEYDSLLNTFNNVELQSLHQIPEASDEWKDPAMIGKFQTNSFLMQWNIEDAHDIWSFDLRFYPMNINIDENPETELPAGYIYRHFQNLPPPPDKQDPSDFVKPNGQIMVPDLALNSNPSNGHYIKITEKTTIRVVASCYDAANNVMQEKTLGYFIFWPKADMPWIVFSAEDLRPPEYYDNNVGSLNMETFLKSEAFMIYPGRDIKASAYQAQGVKEVIYTIYRIDEINATLATSTISPVRDYIDLKKENQPRNNNVYSTNFS